MKLNNTCSDCFAGLACGIRIDILNLLQEKKKISVLEIAKHFKVTQPTITHHLKYLQEVGLIKSKKEGAKVFYFIDPKCGSEGCEIFG